MADIIDYNKDLEHLLKLHAEECESFSILHRYSYEKYSERSNYINIPVIILSSAIGFATGIDIGYDKMNIILGVSSIFVGIIKSIDTYFQLGKRSESHRLCSLQFQQINKKIMIELSLKREQRISAKDMLQIIKTDIKNLQDIAPLIDEEIIKIFKKNYGEEDPITKKIKFTSHTPNLCNGLTQVTVNGDKPGGRGRRNQRRRSRDRRSRGSSRGSRSYDSEDESSSGGDSGDGRGGRGSGGSRGSRGSRGGDRDKTGRKDDGNVSGASASSGFMSSVSNLIQKGVNYIKGNTPPPTPLGSSSDRHRSHSGHHHSHGAGNKNDSSSSPHGDKHNNKVIEILGTNIADANSAMVLANKEIGDLISIPTSAITSATNSAPISTTNSVKNTPQLGAINQQLANNLPPNFTVVNISDIQESAIQLQQLQQLQQQYQGQPSYRSNQSNHSNHSNQSKHSNNSYRPAVPEAVAASLAAARSRPVSRPNSSAHTPLRTTPSILNQLSVQNINDGDNGAGTGFVLTADMVYRTGDNLESNITINPSNIIQPNENNENNVNNENIVVDVLPFNDQDGAPPVSGALNVPPVLHFDIDDPEGMM